MLARPHGCRNSFETALPGSPHNGQGAPNQDAPAARFDLSARRDPQPAFPFLAGLG